jgi:DNA-binding NtrC family response regulator
MRSKMETMVDEMSHDGIKLNQALKEVERRCIEAALNRGRGNRSLAARTLGIHRNIPAQKIHDHRLPR